ncbi:hypothetical protein ACMZ4X_00607 [Achromobacter marplatensis]
MMQHADQHMVVLRGAQQGKARKRPRKQVESTAIQPAGGLRERRLAIAAGRHGQVDPLQRQRAGIKDALHGRPVRI